MAEERISSYGSILKSSSLIGGSQLVSMLVGIVRTKFAAVLLGPAGVGLVGTYYAIQQFAMTLAGLGIGQSGVRDISEARGREEARHVAETVYVIRKLSVWLGLLGAIIMVLLAIPLSRLTFGDEKHVAELFLVGASVFMMLLGAAQSAILQGFRQIGNLAKASVLGALVGAVTVILWYYFLGIEGIVPSMLTLSLTSFLILSHFSRKIEVVAVDVDWPAFWQRSKSLFQLGAAFMWNGLLLAAMAYLVRWIVLQEFDLAAVGIYSAAYGISGMIVNFVLNAMGADYFPRLSEVSAEPMKMNILVNEQAEIGILLALPAMVALIIFAPVLVHLLYTAEFMEASVLIEWFALGCFARVFQWPLGFVMLAKKKGGLFAGTQTFFHLMHLGFIYLGIGYLGLEGVGVAFVSLYIVSFGMIYFITRGMTGFRWSNKAFHLVLCSLTTILAVYVFSQHVNGGLRLFLGLLTVAAVGVICLRGLLSRVGSSHRIVSVALRFCPWAKPILSI